MPEERTSDGERAARSAEVFGLLARLVHRTGQDAAAELRVHGLTPAQFQLLLAVGERPDGSQREIGERFAVTGANVSMLLAKLVVAAAAVGGLAATAIGALGRRARRPRRAFLLVTGAGLLLSLVPPVVATTTTAATVWLVAMHLAVAVAVVPSVAVRLP